MKKDAIRDLLIEAYKSYFSSKAFIEINKKYIDLNPETKMQVMSKIAEASSNMDATLKFVALFKKYLKEIK